MGIGVVIKEYSIMVPEFAIWEDIEYACDEIGEILTHFALTKKLMDDAKKLD